MSISRRTILAAASMAGAAGLAGSAASQNAAPAAAQPAGGQPTMSYYPFKIGDIGLVALHDGTASRPLEGLIRNAEISDVRKAATEAFLPTDALPITFTPVVLKTGGKTVLIDSGNGDVGAPGTGLLRANLRAAGIDPTTIDVVLISHFHGDHINGLRLKDGSAVFPNAEIMVPAPEWAFWMDDAKMAAAPDAMKGAFQGVRRVFGPVAKDVKRYEWGQEVVAGVTALDAAGHTPGHTAFAIASGGKSLIHVVDVTNHPRLFARHPDWAAVFDMDADKARLTRRRILDMAATDRTQLSFYHAPFPATGHVRREGDGYEFVPAQWMSAS